MFFPVAPHVQDSCGNQTSCPGVGVESGPHTSLHTVGSKCKTQVPHPSRKQVPRKGKRPSRDVCAKCGVSVVAKQGRGVQEEEAVVQRAGFLEEVVQCRDTEPLMLSMSEYTRE
ncbi:hypothetical protein TREES_T100017953 [Tupaia chinensis]|uniref:Uncharacterized protein n=1 Tax=Tupaia chinensis TaxID=246437 RepID=L9JR76_TUPCH|nr:hypothetical protein TREES_T100017953 [Tupaia chinensis]